MLSGLFGGGKKAQADPPAAPEPSDPALEGLLVPHTGGRPQGVEKEEYPEKALSDDRLYQVITLRNGMVACLISDPKTRKAACAMSVGRGHMSDPPELPGLAHFCEHMLCLGSEKYPGDGEYQAWLAQHGGNHNASTGAESTTYQFSVSADHFVPALDRFAQCFVAPLFPAAATEREVGGLDALFQRARNSDAKRALQLLKHVADPGHPFSKFGAGNASTLRELPAAKGIDVRENLLRFHAANYSGNVMRLCVMGRQPLKHLAHIVATMFCPVQNKYLEERVLWSGQPYPPNLLCRMVCYRPVADTRTLTLNWPLPFPGREDYAGKSVSFVADLLGHEAKGSLTCYLQQTKGWITELTVDEKHEGSNYSLLQMTLNLTSVGLQHVDDIIAAVFYCIDMIKRQGPLKWRFEEMQKTMRLRFDYQEKKQPHSTVRNIAQSLLSFAAEDCLSGPYLVTSDMNQERITQVFDALRPDKLLAMLSHQGLPQERLPLTEPQYGTQYGDEALSAATISAIRRAVSSLELAEHLTLPAPNPFIPADFELVASEQDEPPVCIRDDSVPAARDGLVGVTVWHKVDHLFRRAKAVVNVVVVTPTASESPTSVAALRVLALLLDDALITQLYPATDVGFEWRFQLTPEGLLVQAQGFSDQLPAVVRGLMGGVLEYQLDEKRFNVMREKVWKQLKNTSMDIASVVSRDTMETLLKMPHHSYASQEAAMPGLSMDMMRGVLQALRRSLRIRAYCHGNIAREAALQLGDELSRIAVQAGCRSLTDGEWERSLRVVQLPSQETGAPAMEHTRFIQHADPDTANSAVAMYFQLGRRSNHLSALSILLQQFLEPRFHELLRTQEQVGHEVWSGQLKHHNVQGFQMGVMSSTSPPAELHARIDNFLCDFGNELQDLDDELVETSAQSAGQKILQSLQSMKGECDRLHSEIESGCQNWERQEVAAAALCKLGKTDLVRFYRQFIWPEDWQAPHNRRTVCVYCYASAHAEQLPVDQAREERMLPTYDSRGDPTDYPARVVVIDRPAAWKAAQYTYPAWLPY